MRWLFFVWARDMNKMGGFFNCEDMTWGLLFFSQPWFFCFWGRLFLCDK